MGTRAMSGEITYLDRYFMGSDIDAQFSAFHKEFRRTGNFDQTNTGLTAEFTRPISECVKDSVRLRLESIGYDFDNHEPDTKIEDYLAATVRYRLTHDTRDDLFFPTEGSVATGSIETGVADSFLLKLEGQYASYFSVADDWVLANNTMVSLIPTDVDDIGYADRLFMGGSGDLRGFRVSGAGPHDSGNESVPLGGATKLITQFEMRHRFTDNFAGLAFADVGMLGHDPLEFESPRASVGVGVRMRLPVASVSLDLGVPIISQKEDQRQILHFNMTSAW
jgi:outer membrane protein insertion porin family